MQRAVRLRALSAVLQRHVAARRVDTPAVHAQVRIGPRSGDQLLLFVGWGGCSSQACMGSLAHSPPVVLARQVQQPMLRLTRAALQLSSQPLHHRKAHRWLSSGAAMIDVEAGGRQAVTVSERCVKRILKVQGEGFLRLRVDGGGCSGFQVYCQSVSCGCSGSDLQASFCARVSVVRGSDCELYTLKHTHVLRVSVQYNFLIDTDEQEDDVVFEQNGAKLVIDETSLDLVRDVDNNTRARTHTHTRTPCTPRTQIMHAQVHAHAREPPPTHPPTLTRT